MKTEIQLFNNPEFGELRTSQLNDGIVLFCLNDVCKALDIANPRNTIQRLNQKGVHSIDTPTQGGVQSLNFIDEPNLYRCIFQSRKAEAEKFQDWVFEEVLPSIRNAGGYMVSKEDDTPEVLMARALLLAKDTMERQSKELEIERQRRLDIEQQRNILEGQKQIIEEANMILLPKAKYTDEVLQSTSTFTTNQIAQGLGLSAIALNRKLHAAGVQYRQSGQWILTAKHKDKGYATNRVHTYFNRVTEQTVTTQTLVWTEKGRLFIHSLQSDGKL